MDKKIEENPVSRHIKKCLDEMRDKEFVLCIPLRKEAVDDEANVRS